MMTLAEAAKAMSTQQSTPHARRRIHERRLEENLARRTRVLLAEDDRELRRMLAAELRRAGFVVSESGSGFGLLKQLGDLTLRNETVDLIVTDIRMPGMTGLSMISGLRSGNWPGTDATPVILITAFGDEDTHAEARRLGAVLLDKPFDLDDFRACALRLVAST